MTRKEWISRCAARLRSISSASPALAAMCAAECADQQEHLHGSSGAAWQSPEEAADDYEDEVRS